MSNKIMLRVTWIADYPADPQHYEGCDGDPARMAAYDMASIQEGQLDVGELMNNTITLTIEPVSA